jgi:hypothetical protein
MLPEGEEGYHSIPLDLYDDIFPILTIGKRGRIHLHPMYAGRKTLVYISYTQDINIKDNKVELDKGKWKEVKQKRGEDAGESLTIFKNGDMCAPFRPVKYFPKHVEKWNVPIWYVKVFIRKELEKEQDGNTECK